MAFDGITTKVISEELQSLSGARIDKIFQPNKNEIVLGLYLDGKNYALNISIDSQNYRINLTTHSKTNPQVAPNFCMLLRKHLIGLKLKNVISSNLERIVTFEIEGFDEFDDILSKKLIVELMGKHCNIILVDESNIIIDTLRHIKSEDNSNRNMLPHMKYIFPTTTKVNFLDINSFQLFKDNLPDDLNISNISQIISNTYNGISKLFVENIIKTLNIEILNDNKLQEIYNYINNIVKGSNSDNLHFEIIENKMNDKIKKDYFLKLGKSDSSPFALNFFIDDFYFAKESSEDFKSYRNTTLKLILGVLKKYNTRLLNIQSKLKECENMDIYKLYGELIIANLYKIENKNIDSIELENYYENNKLITIPLDKKYSPNENAKLYYKKYTKLKNTLEICRSSKKGNITRA